MEEKMDVEEISLRELIEVLLKGKKVIALFLVVAILLSTVVSFYLRENNKMAKIIISLNFEGIESGLNPDGTKFDINVINSPAVLLRALESLEMNELDITIDSIRRNLTITPIVPKQIANYIQSQIEEGKEYTYFPNEFVITLNVDNTRGIKNSNVKELLDEIINSYAEYFKENYSEERMLANIINSIDYDYYDYPEISNLLKNQIEIMQNYLNSKAAQSSGFRSSKTGYTFEDINKSLDLIKTIELNRMNSLIGAFNLTKSVEKLIINYEYIIKMNELEKKKKESELEVAKEMMESYKRETNTFLIPGMTSEGMDIQNSEKYYDKLVERATNAGVKAKSISHDIDYYLREIEKLKNDSVDNTAKTKAEEDVLELANAIKAKLTYWLDIINETASDYYEVKFANAIMKISPVEIYADVNIILNVAISAVLGIMIGIFAVFFKEYWEKTSPKANSNS